MIDRSFIEKIEEMTGPKVIKKIGRASCRERV